jgi:hypothetical protein
VLVLCLGLDAGFAGAVGNGRAVWFQREGHDWHVGTEEPKFRGARLDDPTVGQQHRSVVMVNGANDVTRGALVCMPGTKQDMVAGVKPVDGHPRRRRQLQGRGGIVGRTI